MPLTSPYGGASPITALPFESAPLTGEVAVRRERSDRPEQGLGDLNQTEPTRIMDDGDCGTFRSQEHLRPWSLQDSRRRRRSRGGRGFEVGFGSPPTPSGVGWTGLCAKPRKQADAP